MLNAAVLRPPPPETIPPPCAHANLSDARIHCLDCGHRLPSDEIKNLRAELELVRPIVEEVGDFLADLSDAKGVVAVASVYFGRRAKLYELLIAFRKSPFGTRRRSR